MVAILRDRVDVPWIDAAWIGGSDAFGRADARSDVDLSVLVDPDRGDDAFALVEAALAEVGGIDAVYRVPEPTWHGHRQAFYQLRGLPESAMVDLCVMRADRLAPFLDPVRHGRPIVWFDRVGAVVPTPDETLGATFRTRLATLRDRTRLLAHLPAKAAARGRIAEAADLYQRLLLAPLVEVLRARHDPHRQDFGFRYLPEDLPPDLVARIDALSVPGGPDALVIAIDEVRAWLEAELDASPVGQ